jgi:hypothetical protein
MRYELLETNQDGVKIYARIDDDGLCRVTCTEDNPDYQAWLNPTEQSTPIVPTDNYLTPPDTIESTQPDEADLTEGTN